VVKLFFVTDLHGSEICWKKFLNAGPFYGADVVILGGDVTSVPTAPGTPPSKTIWRPSRPRPRSSSSRSA
jgi:predicted phosphodiesterase